MLKTLMLSATTLVSTVLAWSQKDQGIITYKLGTDTTVVQYFDFSKNKFNTSILTLTGQVTRIDGTGELDAGGDIRYVESRTFRIDSTGTWFIVSEATNLFDGDSSIYTATSKGRPISRRAVPGKGIVSNAADAASFFMFPYMGFFAPSIAGDSLIHCQLSFGECRRFEVTRLNNKELKIGSGVMGRIKLTVDDQNRLVSADAVGSSLNFTATVQREYMDHMIYMDQLAKRRFRSGRFAPRTFRDTVSLISGNRSMEIDYWRPYRRNRQIFGAVVPWNRIWRAGANNATQLRTNADIDFNGKKLEAGKYSLWIFPTEKGWELRINSKADVWGTEYDPSADVLKLPMQFERTGIPVEIMTISIVDGENDKFRVLMEWEFYRAWIDFVLKS